MTSRRATLRKGPFLVFIILVCGAIFSYLLKIPWEENVRIFLGSYHEEVSGCYLIVSCFIILCRFFAFIQKGVPPQTRRFGLFGPVAGLISEPLFDASLFYSALFMLNTIFERAHGLSLLLSPRFILFIVAMFLLCESVMGMYRMVREMFYVQKAEKVVRH